MSMPIECHNCGHIYDTNNFMGFDLPYGFKKVQIAGIKIFFCPECEKIQFGEAETKGSFETIE